MESEKHIKPDTHHVEGREYNNGPPSPGSTEPDMAIEDHNGKQAATHVIQNPLRVSCYPLSVSDDPLTNSDTTRKKLWPMPRPLPTPTT